MQLPSQVFTIYKMFHYDRPIIIISSVLNIIISVTLVKPIGIDGVLLGTFVTSLIYLFSRFYIIAKYIYYVQFRTYFAKIISYFLLSAVSLMIIYFSCGKVVGDSVKSFIVRLVLVVLLALFVPFTFLSYTQEFKFLSDKLLPKIMKKYTNKYVFGGISIAVIVLAVSIGQYKTNEKISSLNKSYTRTDSYAFEYTDDDRIFNLSIDDCIDLFKDLTDSDYGSIFENETLAWARTLHIKYGVVTTFYTMYESENFNLSQCPDRYKKEFIQNSNWLRFGFHTLNDKKSYESGDISYDYLKTIKELIRIAGHESIDNVIRLQNFQGSKEGIGELLQLDEEPIIGLLTADDNRQSYYLDEKESNYIYCHDKMIKDDCYFISTDMRMEYVDKIDEKIKELSSSSWNNQTDYLVIFTHEWALNSEIEEKVEAMCKYALKNGYSFVFFEDVLQH